MSDLYQELIIDHAHAPRNQGCCQPATHQQEGYNPLCGDQLDLTLEVRDQIVQDIRFNGSGCAIAMASASMMSEAVKGLPLESLEALFDSMHAMLTSDEPGNQPLLGKLMAFEGVRAYPMRVKCATLAWHTLKAALEPTETPVSTEEQGLHADASGMASSASTMSMEEAS
jgi:nitrogen fixation protein NifU and related proteins